MSNLRAVGGEFGQRCDDSGVERPEPAPVQRVGGGDLAQHRLAERLCVFARRCLQLDDQQRPPVHRRQRLRQRWHVLASARIQRAQLRNRRRADRPRAAGGALEQRVVQQHGHAVGAQLHINFDPVRAEFERAANAQQRVFGRVPHCRAVGDHERACGGRIVRWRGHARSIRWPREARVQEADIAQAFDAAAADYGRLGAGFLGLYGAQLLERLALQPDADLVDLGCGPGILVALGERDVQLGSAIGVDLSRVQLALARERFRRSPLRPRFIHESAAATTLRDHSADAVALGFVLPYADAPERILREAARIGRRGARVAATVWGSPFFGAAGERLWEVIQRRGIPAADVDGRYEPQRLAQTAFRAELEDVTVEEFEREVWWDDFDEWWDTLAAFALLPVERPERLAAARQQLAGDARVVDPDGKVRSAPKVWLLSATVAAPDDD